MFKVKNNDEIGRYLSDLIDKKYIKTRRFCKAYIQALGKEVTDEEIQRQEKRILAIRKGKNAIQLEDLPVFTELFDISCEEILSAGECHSVNENHITNYQLAFSHDERLWKSYISEDGDRFLNPDEYDKTILDYAFELKNYPLLKYLVDNHYIWFVEQNPGERCGMSFYGGTSIKRRPLGNSKTMEAQLTGNDSLRRKMIVLAIENNDMDIALFQSQSYSGKLLRDYSQKEFPFYQYFYYTNYLDIKFINEKLSHLDPNNYPVLIKYLEYYLGKILI